ncbi:MAG: ArsC family reductase [Methylomonas sp.]|nr:MAG: ArsC family reductase [Methylomonas sp.]PPD26575.1 MAG: ArsC family reductase [Methylomonas sp.]PPD38370.1 MAG: ArsC family reductase [Methylomonas sp.]PPD42838.1 MAG: ArsC family reductase [Methylomonas sp.]PPD56015.1 MAG: ArsC family reductase [Methylomonas sp.]
MTAPDITVFGIHNCDSIKKTRLWLEQRAIAYQFHDFRVDGLDSALLDWLIDAVGYEALLNRRSTGWRQLTDEQKTGLDGEKAAALMLAMPTLIKRPLIRHRGQFSVGRKIQDIIQTHHANHD